MVDAYTLHKPIRNRIRRFDRDALLDITMGALLANEKDIINTKGYIPWECMLLIRWILQYAQPGRHLKRPNTSTLNTLLNDIKNLYDSAIRFNPSEPHGLHKFLRRLTYQQFTYQMPLPEMGWRAGRQLILFTQIGEQYHVNDVFEKEAGLSIKDFISISFAIFSILQSDDKYALEAETLFSIFHPDIVQKYFDLTAVNAIEAKRYLDADSKNKGKRFVLQLYELSPLVRKPFYTAGSRYILFSKRLFRQFFSHFIYDYLYSLPDSFSSFGSILEKYVRLQLDAQELKPILDKSWKKILKKPVSAPDFTIAQDCATTFIEVKRKHLPDISKVLQTNDTFSRHLDDSVVKGIVQIYSLANELIINRPSEIKNFNNFYGVVVTYKDDHLRGGKQFWEEFLEKEVLKELKRLKIDSNIIPPENIFLLPIDEVDYLLAFLKKNSKHNFSTIFEKVKEYEANPATSKFFFHDHLQTISGGQIPRPEHLWRKFTTITDEMVEKLIKAKKT